MCYGKGYPKLSGMPGRGSASGFGPQAEVRRETIRRFRGDELAFRCVMSLRSKPASTGYWREKRGSYAESCLFLRPRLTGFRRVAIKLMMNEGLKTSETQLRTLKTRGSDGDWEGFYRKYAGVILSFCKKQGLDDFSARDVLQESMILLMRKLPGFTYSESKGRFRNWLLTLVYGKVRDARRRLIRRAEQPWQESSLSGEAASPSAGGDLAEDEVESAWRMTLLEEGLKRLKRNPRIKSETMEVFEACVIHNMTIPAVAAKFQLEENNIYQIKNRLIRKLREEIEDLEQNQALPTPSSV